MNFNSPFIEKASESEEHPCCSINSSIMKRWESEFFRAHVMASSKLMILSTRVTPLLPAESTGFTITGHWNDLISDSASFRQ